MVLEHIFPEDWLEKKGRYAFILGIGYSIVGVLLASILFPGDPALVAVAFTSMLLLPELYKIFSIEERKESMEQKVTMRNLWKDDFDIVRIYVFLFLGILLVYSVGALMMPQMQSNSLFREQLEIRFHSDLPVGDVVAGSGGLESSFWAKDITWDWDLFSGLLSNNLLVLIACFIMALLTGDGAIFLITWNASVWGTIFGITAKGAGTFIGSNPFYIFGLVFLIVFPHMMIEGISYFLAAISGSVISKDVILEKFASARFFEVFSFNLYLLLVGLGFLLLGAFVETFVLKNVAIYQEIIRLSMLAFA
jgi:hypothetical protein